MHAIFETRPDDGGPDGVQGDFVIQRAEQRALPEPTASLFLCLFRSLPLYLARSTPRPLHAIIRSLSSLLTGHPVAESGRRSQRYQRNAIKLAREFRECAGGTGRRKRERARGGRAGRFAARNGNGCREADG